MPTVTLTPDALEVRLAGREKLAGLLRDLRVPRSAVTHAAVADDALGAVRGVRAPGLGLPGLAKIGTWRGSGGRQYVVARRGVPALVLELAGTPYRSAVVSVDDARELAAQLSS